MNDWSNKAIGFLTAYLIIFGLLSVYQVSKTPVINPNLVAFGSTAISILLLAFSQMEFAQDYKMRAQYYLDCALKISKLYNKLRIAKTLNEKTMEEKESLGRDISDKYQSILNKYPESIDYEKFQAEQWTYYELNFTKRAYIYTSHYLRTLFLYHCLIVIPPIIMTIVYLSSLHGI